MKPNTIIENSSDLDLCDIDQNYNWTGNIKWCYSNINLEGLSNFI